MRVKIEILEDDLSTKVVFDDVTYRPFLLDVMIRKTLEAMKFVKTSHRVYKTIGGIHALVIQTPEADPRRIVVDFRLDLSFKESGQALTRDDLNKILGRLLNTPTEEDVLDVFIDSVLSLYYYYDVSVIGKVVTSDIKTRGYVLSPFYHVHSVQWVFANRGTVKVARFIGDADNFPYLEIRYDDRANIINIRITTSGDVREYKDLDEALSDAAKLGIVLEERKPWQTFTEKEV